MAPFSRCSSKDKFTKLKMKMSLNGAKCNVADVLFYWVKTKERLYLGSGLFGERHELLKVGVTNITQVTEISSSLFGS